LFNEQKYKYLREMVSGYILETSIDSSIFLSEMLAEILDMDIK